MLNSVILLLVFSAITHQIDADEIFRSGMESVTSGADGWSTAGSTIGGTCDDYDNNYCLADQNGDKHCTELRNGCILQSPTINTAGFKDVKFTYFISQHTKKGSKLEGADEIKFQYSLDGGNNFITFKTHKGGSSIAADGQGTYTTNDLITESVPQLDDSKNGVIIRITNINIEGNQDKVYVDEIRVTGTAGTPSPTAVTPAPITKAPITKAPTTQQPTTKQPTTKAPTAPTTRAPTAPTAELAPGSYVDPCLADNSKRNRRPWHLYSDADKALFAEAINLLNNKPNGVNGNSILHDFALAHQRCFMGQPHGSSAFLPWHSWYLFEIESQLRALGDKYKCVTLPYWDIVFETDASTTNEPWWICSDEGRTGGYGQGYGSLGGTQCIGAPFAGLTYEDAGSGAPTCIKRNPGTTKLANSADFFNLIGENKLYGLPNEPNNACSGGFRYHLEYDTGFHGSMHCYIGGNLCTTYSPSDIMFYLIHTFVDFTWRTWQTCHSYDSASPGFGYCGDINEVLTYDLLETRPYSSYDTSNPIQVRDVLDNSALGISYEIGDFGDSDYSPYIADPDDGCTKPLSQWNPNWIRDSGLRTDTSRRRLKGGNGGKGGRGGPIKGGKNRNASKRRKKKLFDNIVKDGKLTRPKRKALRIAECNDDQTRTGTICDLPVSYSNCDDIPDSANGDIDISLRELLNRVDGSKCMTETRERFYPWAKVMGRLRQLCDGEYDSFCDKDLLKTKLVSYAAANSIVFGQETEEMIRNINKNSNYNKYIIFGSIGIIIIVFLSLCMYFIINGCCKTKIYSKVGKEFEIDTDGSDESADEQELL